MTQESGLACLPAHEGHAMVTHRSAVYSKELWLREVFLLASTTV